MPQAKDSHSTFSNLDYSFPVHHKNWIMQLWLMSYELMTPKSSNDQIFLYALCGEHIPHRTYSFKSILHFYPYSPQHILSTSLIAVSYLSIPESSALRLTLVGNIRWASAISSDLRSCPSKYSPEYQRTVIH